MKKEKAKMLRKAKKAAAMAWGLAVRVGNMTVKGLNNMWSALVRPHLDLPRQQVGRGGYADAQGWKAHTQVRIKGTE